VAEGALKVKVVGEDVRPVFVTTAAVSEEQVVLEPLYRVTL
jgi:hypothetical protein